MQRSSSTTDISVITARHKL